MNMIISKKNVKIDKGRHQNVKSGHFSIGGAAVADK